MKNSTKGTKSSDSFKEECTGMTECSVLLHTDHTASCSELKITVGLLKLADTDLMEHQLDHRETA